MLVKTDFRQILIVNGICSLTEEMKVGDLFLTLDHLNLNGSSPQMGPNEDSWGKWFYDCSNIYYTPYSSKFKQIYDTTGGRPIH